MPFVQGNRRNVYKDIVAGSKTKVRRAFDHKVGDFGGQKDPRRNICFSSLRPHPEDSEQSLNYID